MKRISKKETLRNYIRWWFMPGFDLFTRRRIRLCRYWSRGPRRVLDAGSGNGWFSYLAYRSGATVVAVNFNQTEVQKAICFYNTWRRIPPERLQFKELNLYNCDSLEPEFDEIICYETLEHIKDDIRVCKIFWKLLKLGGSLHLCCPNAEHPHWCNEPLDLDEKGSHVRAGYNLESYRSLLEPIGFEITDIEGIGGQMLTWTSIFLDSVRKHLGNVWSLPLVLLFFPLVWLDSRINEYPYCLYVRAIKPTIFSS